VQVYKNIIVIQWRVDDVRDNCTSFRPVEHYQQLRHGRRKSTHSLMQRRHLRHPENLVALAPLELGHVLSGVILNERYGLFATV
jgi:hypothetical protein